MSFLPDNLNDLPSLKVGTSPTTIKVLQGPYVKYSDWGYTPVLHVKVEKSGLEYLLPISAKSLTKALNAIYCDEGSIENIRIELRKLGEDKMAPYDLLKLTENE